MKAQADWVKAGREVQLETAAVYHSVVTYSELAEEVQRRSGVLTRAHMRHWIGPVLGVIATDSAERGEPGLTALCVKQDGTVGDGYAAAVVGNGGQLPIEPDQHAAEERLACYRAFGAVLPADGGQRALTPQVAHAHSQQARRRAAHDARRLASSISPRVILIDGPRLGELMVRHGVGVRVVQVFTAVELDEDFFE